MRTFRLLFASLAISSSLLAGTATLPVETEAPAANGDVFNDPFESRDDRADKSKISDPLEPINRGVFFFNDRLYFWVLKPVATGYKFIAPRPVREHLALFFQNTKFPIRFGNNLLQGKFKGAGIETARFAINTTVGLAGFFDPASKWKLDLQKADFDQTLGFYNIPTGCYIVWPVLGPSSIRGTFGLAGDSALSPLTYINGAEWLRIAKPTEVINSTSLRLGEYEAFKKSTLDPYVGMRSSFVEYWEYRDRAKSQE